MGFFSGILKAALPAVGSFFGGPLGGSIGSGIAGVLGQSEANEANKNLAGSQMAWQERMSSTAHQREVKDLIAAGLNPMLSVNHGGASTPVGSLARVENTFSKGIESQLASASMAKIRADTDASETQAALNRANALKVAQDTRYSAASAAQAEYQVRINDALDRSGYSTAIPISESEARFWKAASAVESDKRGVGKWSMLDDMASRMGYNNYQTAMDAIAAKMANQVLRLKGLEIPKGVALSDFYKSGYGHDIAPYLNSASDAAAIGGSVVGTVRKAIPGSSSTRLYRKGK